MTAVNRLPKTVTRRRRGCDLNPGPTVPESSTLKAKFHYTSLIYCTLFTDHQTVVIHSSRDVFFQFSTLSRACGSCVVHREPAIETRYRTGARGDTISPPPMTVRFKNRGGSTSVRGRVRSPHMSGSRRWLSCRQPACL